MIPRGKSELPASPLDESGLPTVLTEDWSDYRASDGSRIRAKLVVFQFVGLSDLRSMQPGQVGNVAIKGNLQISAVSPVALRGPPELLSPAEISQAPKSTIKISRTQEEPWNYYLILDDPGEPKFVRVKLTVAGAQRVTGHFDQDGNALDTIQTAVAGVPASKDEVVEALDDLRRRV
jgi:hypothetical protein